MCGRYSLIEEQDNLDVLRLAEELRKKYPGSAPRFGEIFPTNDAPVLLPEGGRTAPVLATWGFPGFRGSGVIINARAETAAQKPTFRESFAHGRCAVPSTGFYEWSKEKQKYLFRLPGARMVYMAGLCGTFGGVRRFVILTTAANDSMRPVHDRMPVILPPEELPAWISAPDRAAALLEAPMPALERIAQ